MRLLRCFGWCEVACSMPMPRAGSRLCRSTDSVCFHVSRVPLAQRREERERGDARKTRTTTATKMRKIRRRITRTPELYHPRSTPMRAVRFLRSGSLSNVHSQCKCRSVDPTPNWRAFKRLATRSRLGLPPSHQREGRPNVVQSGTRQAQVDHHVAALAFAFPPLPHKRGRNCAGTPTASS